MITLLLLYVDIYIQIICYMWCVIKHIIVCYLNIYDKLYIYHIIYVNIHMYMNIIYICISIFLCVYLYIYRWYIYMCVWAISETPGSWKGHPQIWKGPIACDTFAQKWCMANLEASLKGKLRTWHTLPRRYRYLDRSHRLAWVSQIPESNVRPFHVKYAWPPDNQPTAGW